MATPTGFQNAAFNNATVGPNGVALQHAEARTRMLNQAESILRQPLSAVPNVQGLTPATTVQPGQIAHPNPLLYEEIDIFHPIIAEYLSRIFAYTVRTYLHFVTLSFTNSILE